MMTRLHGRSLRVWSRSLLNWACLVCLVYLLTWSFYSGSGRPKSSTHLGDSGPEYVNKIWRSPITVDAASKNATAVREMARFAWQGYITWCATKQGGNELAPATNSCSMVSNRLVGPNNLLTVIDSLDTLHIMGLTEEFDLGRELVLGTFNPRRAVGSSEVSVFETTIRILGGLLGAFSLSRDPGFVRLAADLGDAMSEAFTAGTFPEKVGNTDNLTGKLQNQWKAIFSKETTGDLAEIGSLYLEFAYLAEVTGDRKFFDWVDRYQRALLNVSSMDGVFPTRLAVRAPWRLEPAEQSYSSGAHGDSFYEYLVKRCLFDMSQDPSCIRTFTRSLDGIMKHLTVQTADRHTCITQIQHGVKQSCNMEHLTCFAGGMYTLAYLQNRSRTDWLRFAESVTETCYLSYVHSPTGLGPEKFTFDEESNKFVATNDMYILRPETVESIYYLYHVTGNQKYRNWGWNIALALNSTARTATGFSGLKQMLSKPVFDDSQWSFFLAETLKYLYLLFSPVDRLPMDQWLFSTEAHVIPNRLNSLRPHPSQGRLIGQRS